MTRLQFSAALIAAFALSGCASGYQTFYRPVADNHALTPPAQGPCDILAARGKPCIAAHSLSRRMIASYTGSLFQVTRISDSTTLNVGFGSSGWVDLQPMLKYCGGITGCLLSEIYDQMGTPSTGNNLPQSTLSVMPELTLGRSPFGPVPIAEFYGLTYLRNRAATVNMPTGASHPTTEYMVVDTRNQSSACCGAYGNMEATVDDTGKGHMFTLAYSSGAGGTVGSGNGPWAGVDWENGVYLYGATPNSAPAMTVLAKYNNSGPSWALKAGPVGNSGLDTLYSGALPDGYTAAFEGGLSLGEGGDASPAPVNFIEGAITATATDDATDALLQGNLQQAYGSLQIPPYTAANCSRAAQSANLLTNPFTLSGWTASAKPTETTGVADPLGGANAITITNSSNGESTSYGATANVTAGKYYTFTEYVQRTASAAYFPGVSLVFNASGSPEAAWVLNTNTGQIKPARWGELGKIRMVVSAAGDWWAVTEVVLAPAGSTSVTAIVDAPVANGDGIRGSTRGAPSATVYCPLLQQGIF